LFLNEGTNEDPVFNQSDFVRLAGGEPLVPEGRSAPMVIDLDDDGLKDLVCGHIDGTPYFYKNYGTNFDPLFVSYDTLKTGEVPLDPGATSRFAAIDWDDDGDLDLMGGSIDARIKLYMQTPTTLPSPILSFPAFSPWIIPTSGGVIDFTMAVENTSSQQLTFDVWTEVLLPDYTFYDILLSRSDLTLGPSQQISRDFTQNVPGGAPNGLYTYIGYIGDVENLQIFTGSEFYWHKMDIGGGEEVDNWDVFDSSGERGHDMTRQKEADISLSAAPNPFNSSTEIEFRLHDPADISLKIYDLTGRESANLCTGFLPSGSHTLYWDAAGFSSGVYLLKLDAGHYHTKC
ncbi:MAG: FG-GAP-like repeat-containing protein, partial [Planctomycetota bacterium]